MKNLLKKKYLLVSLFLLAVIAGIYAYTEYNRGPANLEHATPEINTSALALVSLYETDEIMANEKFLGKTILVTGPLAEVKGQQDSILNVFLGVAEEMHKVSCLLNADEADKLKNYALGSSISIKGVCTGYLVDVELSRCVIVEQTKNTPQ